MNDELHTLSAALLPLAGMTALAALRCRSDVQVVVANDRAWVTWPAGDEAVLRGSLPVAGAEFFREASGVWFRLGCRLPAADAPPAGKRRPLQDVLTPAAFAPLAPDDPVLAPVVFGLVPSATPRATSAALYPLSELSAWADSVSSFRLKSLTAARLKDEVLLRGSRLPALSSCVRLWGERVRLPLGQRLDPDLAADAVCEVLGVAATEFVVWTDAGPEAIAEDAFSLLQRASLRLAQEEETDVR